MALFLDLDVALKAVKPPVKRRFLLSAEASLVHLAAAVRDAFGWSGQKAFEAWRAEPGSPPLAAAGDLAAFRRPLAEVLAPPCRSLIVVYDPDAWWEHVVTLKRTRELPDDAVRRFVSGKGATPPEHCGGLAGYEAWRADGGVLPEPDLDDLRTTFDA